MIDMFGDQLPLEFEPGATCHECGSSNVFRTPGAGPHYAGLRCRDCHAHRWLPTPRDQNPSQP